jgi:hypothetical protein
MYGNTLLRAETKPIANNLALTTSWKEADVFTPGHASAFLLLDWTKGTETELQFKIEAELDGVRFPLSVVSADTWQPQNPQRVLVTGQNMVRIVELPELPIYVSFKGLGTVSGTLDAFISYLERRP